MTDHPGLAGRIFAVLDAFDGTTPSLRLTDIAARTGLPMPTALRLARDLVAWGGLERARDGSYRLGTRMWALGVRAPCHRRIRLAAEPFVRQLTHPGLTVELGVPDRSAVLLLTGERHPLHATAIGKCLLTLEPIPDDLPRRTPFTITEPGRLARVVAEVRRGGVAFESEELRLGHGSVAALLPDVPAAIGIRARSTVDLRRFVPALRSAARRLSGSLTSRPATTSGSSTSRVPPPAR